MVVGLARSEALLKLLDLGPAAKIAAALLPAPAFLLFVAAEVRVARRQDELQKRIQLEALAIAYPLAITVVMVLSLLQKAHLWRGEPLWIYLPITYYIGLGIAQRRYH